MFFLPVLDEKATASKVRSFLKNDYSRLCRDLGKPVSYIKAIKYNDMPKSPSHVNHAMDGIIRRVDMQTTAECTREAFKRVQNYDYKSGKVLFDCYIKRRSYDIVAEELGYSRRRVDDFLINACCQFAGCLYDVSKGRMDLQVWKEE